MKRRGIFEAGILIIAVLVFLIILVAVALSWSNFFEVSFVDLMVKMPKFDYNFTSATGNSTAGIVKEVGNANFEYYTFIRNVSGVFAVIAIMFAGVSFMFEKINLLPPDISYQIISKSLLFMFFFFFFPPVWDYVADGVEGTSRWLLNPDDQEHPEKKVELLLGEIGNPLESGQTAAKDKVKVENFFDALKVLASSLDVGAGLQELFLPIIMTVIKAVAFIIVMFIAFIVGTVRQVLTAVMIIGIPLIMTLSLFPFFKKLTDKFVDTLLALLIAPIFSALVIGAGVAYLQGLPVQAGAGDDIVRWFSALSIVILASMIPAMLAPVMGSLVSTIQGIATTSVMAGVATGGAGALGAGIAVGQTAKSAISSGGSFAAGLASLANPKAIGMLLHSGAAGFVTGAGHGAGSLGIGRIDKVGYEVGDFAGGAGTKIADDQKVKNIMKEFDARMESIPDSPLPIGVPDAEKIVKMDDVAKQRLIVNHINSRKSSAKNLLGLSSDYGFTKLFSEFAKREESDLHRFAITLGPFKHAPGGETNDGKTRI